jgi:deoxyribodipyrimidine photolyase-related protein
MGSTLFLWSHQLHPKYIEVAKLNPREDQIILIDSDDQWTHYHFHKQRILLHLSAMHHFVDEYSRLGWNIKLIKTPSVVKGLSALSSLIIFRPTNAYEQRWIQQVKTLRVLEDPLFLIPTSAWSSLLPTNQTWKLDPLYRKFRKQFAILMDGNEPVGGKFSFDTENRQSASSDVSFIPSQLFPMDAITIKLKKAVEQRFTNHPGKIEDFAYPVSRQNALSLLKHFLTNRLPTFGDYQDAMLTNQPWMSHSLIASSLNLGLLSPLEVIQGAESMYRQGKAPIASTEGFIRQILGWREYVRGVYLVMGEDYLKVNHFQHQRPLPDFYYHGKTEMNCLKNTIEETIQHGYNHHIQRLMVLSNYANLAEVNPQSVNRWFNEMYIDSSEWVVAANVLGMGLHADGGKMATKPYISSGAYINKMSNYCDDCSFQVTLKTGKKACPFNSLYWHYLATKQDSFKSNPRMSMMLNVWGKMQSNDQQAILDNAKEILK